MFHVVSPGNQPCASRESGARSFQHPVNLQDGQIEQTALVLLRSAVKIAIFERLWCVRTGLVFCRGPVFSARDRKFASHRANVKGYGLPLPDDYIAWYWFSA